MNSLRRWSLVLFLSFNAFGSAITFVTALPVATEQIVVRFNAQPIFQTSDYFGVNLPMSIVYGYNPRLAFFTTLNQGFSAENLAGPGGAIARVSTAGASDTLFFLRYTLFRRDRPGSIFRIAPLAGAFFPAGRNDSSSVPIFYYTFDALMISGKDIRSEPLKKRRELLRTKILSLLKDPIRYSPTLDSTLNDLIQSVPQQRFEGLIAKRCDSIYESGQRSGAWLKT